jgi:hypothetical protein
MTTKKTSDIQEDYETNPPTTPFERGIIVSVVAVVFVAVLKLLGF